MVGLAIDSIIDFSNLNNFEKNWNDEDQVYKDYRSIYMYHGLLSAMYLFGCTIFFSLAFWYAQIVCRISSISNDHKAEFDNSLPVFFADDNMK